MKVICDVKVHLLLLTKMMLLGIDLAKKTEHRLLRMAGDVLAVQFEVCAK